MFSNSATQVNVSPFKFARFAAFTMQHWPQSKGKALKL